MMKVIKRTNGMMALLAAGTLQAGVTCAEEMGLSDETPLDTRSLSYAVVI